MADVDLIDRLLPVATLLLGAALTTAQTRWQNRGALRREASELLAEHPRHTWEKDTPNAWLDLQVYLGRLHGRLRAAGVPLAVIGRLEEATREFWRGLEDTGDPEIGWSSQHSRHDQMAGAVDAVALYLDHPWGPARRRARRKDREKPEELEGQEE